jgi:penicillin-binding protein 2
MASEHEERSEYRIILLRIAIIVVFVVYIAKLFSMQILSGDLYRSRAQNIAKQSKVIPAQRGEIYDRNYNQPLVMNTESFSVSITPAELPRESIPELISRLALILNIDREQIEKKLPPSIYYLYQPVEVAANLSYPTVAALAEQADSFPGVSWQSKPIRNYPEMGSLSHIIGYVGSITRDELTMLYNKGYQQGDIIGKNGIERQYDELLRGKEGRETRTVDVRGKNVARDNVRISPESGKNLVLTIDRKIQTLAEKALGSRIGAVVVLRPANGEILAMVSYPCMTPIFLTGLIRGRSIRRWSMIRISLLLTGSSSQVIRRPRLLRLL